MFQNYVILIFKYNQFKERMEKYSPTSKSPSFEVIKKWPFWNTSAFWRGGFYFSSRPSLLIVKIIDLTNNHIDLHTHNHQVLIKLHRWILMSRQPYIIVNFMNAYGFQSRFLQLLKSLNIIKRWKWLTVYVDKIFQSSNFKTWN